jgi:hypothetical protein
MTEHLAACFEEDTPDGHVAVAETKKPLSGAA